MHHKPGKDDDAIGVCAPERSDSRGSASATGSTTLPTLLPRDNDEGPVPAESAGRSLETIVKELPPRVVVTLEQDILLDEAHNKTPESTESTDTDIEDPQHIIWMGAADSCRIEEPPVSPEGFDIDNDSGTVATGWNNDCVDSNQNNAESRAALPLQECRVGAFHVQGMNASLREGEAQDRSLTFGVSSPSEEENPGMHMEHGSSNQGNSSEHLVKAGLVRERGSHGGREDQSDQSFVMAEAQAVKCKGRLGWFFGAIAPIVTTLAIVSTTFVGSTRNNGNDPMALGPADEPPLEQNNFNEDVVPLQPSLPSPLKPTLERVREEGVLKCGVPEESLNNGMHDLDG